MADLWPTCMFRPGNLMRLDEGRVEGMAAEALADDGGTIVCHDTLDKPLFDLTAAGTMSDVAACATASTLTLSNQDHSSTSMPYFKSGSLS